MLEDVGEEEEERVRARRAPPVLLALLDLNGGYMMAASALHLAQSAAQFASPLLLKAIVTYLQAGGSPAKAYVCAGLMFLIPLLASFAFNHAMRLGLEVQTRVRAQVRGVPGCAVPRFWVPPATPPCPPRHHTMPTNAPNPTPTADVGGVRQGAAAVDAVAPGGGSGQGR